MDTWLSDCDPRFILGRGVIAESRVSTLPIVEHLDVFEDVSFGLVSGGIAPMVYEFLLERPKETFNAYVVPTVAFAAHAGSEAVLSQSALVVRGGLLTAAVRMMHEPRPGSAVHHGHRQGLLGQLTG